MHSCLEDLKLILETTIRKQMHLPLKNLKHFSCVLVVPDHCSKVHWKYIIKMIFDMGFKAIFLH